ncbi:ketopantoate reductase family protein [Staphylococcus lugdunensis]|uniref:ketopantoate reductase family protein n=1 Tax=Staphylococcus lugdunensis TaxID=28035 RepID=UPI0001F15D86|nr:2-dehydropantoate 2-reductase [Staphylococcus lugdunensis]EFU83512.1 2-dehydropantoate 2-reductase [Staphylococcus lugdunensis M23590]SQE70517.1 2-dehydropantoate 2-reductase [Staphylococcus lugdunensis]
MYKIAIAGAGAMGGRIGVSLKQAGYDVTLIDDWQEHVNCINENGMEVQTEIDTYTVNIPAVLTKDVSGQFDLIIILTKAMQSEKMLQHLQEANTIHKDTAILSMMNGLGHEERLSKLVPLSQIYLAVTMWTAGLRGPGQLLLEGEGAIDLQRADREKDSRTEVILNMLNTSGLNAQISSDVFKSIWSKATLNSVLNPLCTILDKTIYEFGCYEDAQDMITPIVDEIISVGQAKHIDLNRQTLLDKIEASYPKEAQGLHYPSMHQDYNNGRLTEIDYLNGQIVEYGKVFNIPTPTNALITHLIHQLEMKNH